jgi:hypothetical protein
MISNATVNQVSLSSLSFMAATNYDCASYGAGNYNDSALCTTEAPNTGIAPTDASPLSTWTVGGIVLGVVLVVCGFILIFKKHRARPSVN